MARAPEQEVTMSTSIESMGGVGPATMEVFREAGYTTIQQLAVFDAEDRRLLEAIQRIKQRPEKAAFPASYWLAMGTRCVTIIYRARSKQATPYVPHEYMCPISLDWYVDPVVAPSGHSFSRAHIVSWLERGGVNPLTHEPLSIDQLYTNKSLADAVNHYRLHHQKFSILD